MPILKNVFFRMNFSELRRLDQILPEVAVLGVRQKTDTTAKKLTVFLIIVSNELTGDVAFYLRIGCFCTAKQGCNAC